MEYAKTDLQSGYFPPVGGELEKRYRELSNRYGYLVNSGAGAEEISKTLEEMNLIMSKAEKIWLESVGADEETILAKTRETINAISKEEVTAHIKKERETVTKLHEKRLAAEKEAREQGKKEKAAMLRELNKGDEELLSGIFALSFDGAWAYLAARTFWLRRALEHYSIPLTGYNALLDGRASEYGLPRKRRGRPSTRSDEQALQLYNAQIDQLMIPGFFDEPYRKILQGTPQLMLMPASTRKMKVDAISGKGTLHIEGKGDIIVQDLSGISAALTASTRKLLDTSAAILAERLPYKPSADQTIDPVVRIDLTEWGKACGLDLLPRHCDTTEEMDADKRRLDSTMHDFKATARKDCKTLRASSITFKEGSAFYNMGIVSGYGIKDSTLRIAFDVDFARYLANAYIMQWPTALLKHDNRDPNGYSIGWKLAYHNSMDSNRSKGTETRISVGKLLEAAPQIMSYEDMIASGNKGWKRLIKAPLEKALDAQIAVGYLTRWAYYQRDEELTREQAGALSYEDFAALMVEYAPAEDIPDQTDRLIAKAERIAKAEKKKRGRPRKNKSE